MPSMGTRTPSAGIRRRMAQAAAAVLAAVLVMAGPTTAHQVRGWWKYDPAFWRHRFRAHQELRQIHRSWHERHRRPKHPGPTLDRYVFVRVMDRGPSGDGRVIDLAKRAFERLAQPSSGLVDVKIYRLES